MLVSAVLDFQTMEFTPGNELPYVLFLPTYAATAWYHRKVRCASRCRSCSRRWSSSRRGVRPGAVEGRQAPKKRAGAIIQRLARYTGLAEEYMERATCASRISASSRSCCARAPHSRPAGQPLTGIDQDSAGETIEYDPS